MQNHRTVAVINNGYISHVISHVIPQLIGVHQNNLNCTIACVATPFPKQDGFNAKHYLCDCSKVVDSTRKQWFRGKKNLEKKATLMFQLNLIQTKITNRICFFFFPSLLRKHPILSIVVFHCSCWMLTQKSSRYGFNERTLPHFTKAPWDGSDLSERCWSKKIHRAIWKILELPSFKCV